MPSSIIRLSRQRAYHGACAVAHGKDVLQPGGEDVSRSVLHRNDVERARVPSRKQQ